MKCIDTNSVDYLSLQEYTGLMPYELNALIRDYYEKYNKIPTMDRCLTIDHDTSKHLIETYGLKKLGKQYTTKNLLMVDPVEINKIYRDLEVSVKQSVRGYPIIDIKLRALPHRDLQTDSTETIFPTTLDNTQELIAIDYTDGKYIYQQDGLFYVSDHRISDPKLLNELQSYDNYENAKLAKALSKPKGYTSIITTAIKSNINKLKAGYEIEVNSRQELPVTFSIVDNFGYPKFIVNPNLKEKFTIKQGVIVLNSLEDLEYNLLLALGASEELADTILKNSTRTEFETIKTGNDTYVIRKVRQSYNVLKDNGVREINVGDLSLEPLLDRLEELYGVTFNRVTNDDIRKSGLNNYIPDATQVNAFILDGQIYINMDNARLDAPIHELSHLLLGSLRLTNPELYSQIVNSVENYPEYLYELKKYKNRSRMDANEEIFVDLFARQYAGLLDLGIDQNLMDDVEYEIGRNIDSAIFPNISTTKKPLSELMGKSMLEIMMEFGTVITKDNIAKAFDNSIPSRRIANIKQSLFETDVLKEYCNG